MRAAPDTAGSREDGGATRVLPDTSVWVEYLRLGPSGPAGALHRLLDRESVLVCGPVLAELVAGTPPSQREDLWIALASLPWAELDHGGWRRVGEVAHDLRQAGRSLPLTDVEIAVACVEAGAALWTRDRDFERLREALPPLRLFEG